LKDIGSSAAEPDQIMGQDSPQPKVGCFLSQPRRCRFYEVF